MRSPARRFAYLCGLAFGRENPDADAETIREANPYPFTPVLLPGVPGTRSRRAAWFDGACDATEAAAREGAVA